MRLIDADALLHYLNVLWSRTMPQGTDCGEAANERAAMCRGIDDCIGVVQRFPSARSWISVKNKLPDEGKTVLVARKYVQPGHKERRYVETAERIGFEWVSETDEYKLHRQFHTQPYAWMPLPTPPEVNHDYD